jgi:hypothetical protein
MAQGQHPAPQEIFIMALTYVRGRTQVRDIVDASIAADAAIATSKLADGASFVNWTNAVNYETPAGDVNDVNTDFTLEFPEHASSLYVYLNGLVQEKGASADYTTAPDSGGFTVITFAAAPKTDDKVRVSYFKA